MKNIFCFAVLVANLLVTVDLFANVQTVVDPRLVDANSYVAIKIGQVETDPQDGAPLTLSYNKAVKHCAKKGSRLPSPREYQIFNSGSDSILDSQFPDLSIDDPVVRREMKFMENNWWFFVTKKNAEGDHVIDFYYDERTLWKDSLSGKSVDFYWTLREDPRASAWAFAYKSGGNGERAYATSSNPKSTQFLVRCIEK